jgi:hypothetical protein
VSTNLEASLHDANSSTIADAGRDRPRDSVRNRTWLARCDSRNHQLEQFSGRS